MRRRHLAKPICFIVAMSMSLFGCSSVKSDDKSESNTTVGIGGSTEAGGASASSPTDIDTGEVNSSAKEDNTAEDNTAENNTAENNLEASANGAVTTVSEEEINELFTERDFDNGYNEKSAIKINLKSDTAECSSKSVEIADSTITISAEGTYVLSGTLDNGMIIVDVADTDKVQLVLDNADINNDTSAAIYVREADKVFITTTENSDNTLSGGKEYIAIDDNNIDATIFSKGDITLNGLGTLNVTSETGHGICSKDDLKITDGDYVINSGNHGLTGKDSVRIAGGTVDITCKEDGIHSENSDAADKGNVHILGGIINIDAGDDGVHAGNNLNIAAGSVDIANCYEGLEALVINVKGGNITLIASDDGFNAAGGNDQSGLDADTGNWMGKGGGMMETNESADIVISGGEIHVNSQGDGIDSNGYVTISGGEIYVDGPTNDGNGAFDFGISSTITGGTIVAVGASGMAEGFTDVENQGAILTSVDNAAEGTDVILLDSSGKEVFSWTASKSFNSVVISTPDIVQGETYTLKTGECETIITMDSLNYRNNAGGGFGDHGGGMNKWDTDENGSNTRPYGDNNYDDRGGDGPMNGFPDRAPQNPEMT